MKDYIMNNIFIIQRVHYEELKQHAADLKLPWPGVSHRLMGLLHFYIIENEDGSAEFIKNRSKQKTHYSPEEYKNFKKEHLN